MSRKSLVRQPADVTWVGKPGGKPRPASTYRAARRHIKFIVHRGEKRPNLQGPFPSLRPKGAMLIIFGAAMRRLGREFRNMRVAERNLIDKFA